jgi:peroxiredoxin
MRALAAFVMLLSSACAGSFGPGASAPLLELELARSDGSRMELSSLRGKPLLLFLFATYDEASQFTLVPLTRIAESEPDVTVIGVALQPEADKFLRLFKRSLPVPFELFYDPDNTVLGGSSALGQVPGVPVVIAIDAEGRVRDSLFGAASFEALHTLAKSAR